MSEQGRLAIVLHTHMPYMEGGGQWPPPSDADSDWCNRSGFGTWPFGEEWLWEAVATCYVPLVDALDRCAARRGDVRVPLTLSLTPVLCDQLEAPGALERCLAFLRTVRPESHRRDIERFRAEGDAAAVAELERSATAYAEAADRLESLCSEPPARPAHDGAAGLLGALGRHASWTSSATHAILPLACLEEAVALQLDVGIAAHQRRFGGSGSGASEGTWEGGLWLPECAYAPWLAGPLADAGVRMTCVELTDRFGRRDPRHLSPLLTEDGPILWPVDRAVIDLVWGASGYPSCPSQRAYDRRTEYHHRVWSTDGRPYDHGRALDDARSAAGEFVTQVRDRVRDGGVCVCALDTELLGHWWHEGVAWLEAVMEEADRQRLGLVRLDEALAHVDPVPLSAAAAAAMGETSWGEGGDLRTWSGPAVADLAWDLRRAELATLAGERTAASAGGRSASPPPRALRELLALGSSDWAFLATRGWAGEYPRERAAWHLAALQRALAGEPLDPHVRNLAPWLPGD